jgi:hypothetical protein
MGYVQNPAFGMKVRELAATATCDAVQVADAGAGDFIAGHRQS